MSGSSIASLAISVLFTGTIASMVGSSDESWWQLHFSQLGNTSGVTGYRFNLALIITGFVITVLAGYVGQAFASGLRHRGEKPGRRPRVLAGLFVAIGLCMAMVGFVPDAVSFVIHVGSASGMVVLFSIFAFYALRYIPDLPKDLIAFTTVVVIGIIVSVLLWVPIGYYNLTGMELIAAGLLFAWLLVFVRSAEATAPAPPVPLWLTALTPASSNHPASSPTAGGTPPRQPHPGSASTTAPCSGARTPGSGARPPGSVPTTVMHARV